MNYEKQDLAVSPVIFEELPHTYTMGEKTLSGITGMIKEYVFPDKYKNVPQRILNAAAERGHKIHSQVQMIVDGWGCDKPDASVDDLFDWASANGIEFIASEYLVSDEQHWATAIDIIDNELNLYDIKTVRTMDAEMRDYLSWQLSVCAYLFEKQNPDKKVGELFGIWLHERKARVIRVDRIDDAIIADLLWAAACGLPWSNPLKPVAVEILGAKDVQTVIELENKISEIEQTLKRLQESKDKLRAGLLELMLRTNTDKWTSPSGLLTLRVNKATVRRTFDAKAFKEDHPETYERYIKETNIGESLTIKIKEQ